MTAVLAVTGNACDLWFFGGVATAILCALVAGGRPRD